MHFSSIAHGNKPSQFLVAKPSKPFFQDGDHNGVTKVVKYVGALVCLAGVAGDGEVDKSQTEIDLSALAKNPKLSLKDRELVQEINIMLNRKPMPWDFFEEDGLPSWNPSEIANAYIMIDYSQTVQMAVSIRDVTARSQVLVQSIDVLLGTDHPTAFRALDLIPLKQFRDIAYEKIVRHYEAVRVPLPEHLKPLESSER